MCTTLFDNDNLRHTSTRSTQDMLCTTNLPGPKCISMSYRVVSCSGIWAYAVTRKQRTYSVSRGTRRRREDYAYVRRANERCAAVRMSQPGNCSRRTRHAASDAGARVICDAKRGVVPAARLGPLEVISDSLASGEYSRRKAGRATERATNEACRRVTVAHL